MRKLNVLIACEESQAECKAFRELGHNAYSCDIQRCQRHGNPDWHIYGDVTPYLAGKSCFQVQSGKLVSLSHWDLIIAHPPCTYLCRAGSVNLYKNTDTFGLINGVYRPYHSERLRRMEQARDFFFLCLNANAPYVAVENPIPMAIAKLPKPSAYACPSWFGVKYTKKTLYWLKNLPPLFAEIVYPNAKCFVTASRGKYRSRTFPQMANAIARQWSDYILRELQ